MNSISVRAAARMNEVKTTLSEIQEKLSELSQFTFDAMIVLEGIDKFDSDEWKEADKIKDWAGKADSEISNLTH
jgi:hypothetical protein